LQEGYQVNIMDVRVLIIGDIMGRAGRNILKDKLQGIIDQNRVDLVIGNGENAAGGKSITPDITRELIAMGVDVITTGNHVWDNNEVLKVIDIEPRLLRPANYPEGVQGKGFYITECKGCRICVLNLQGRLFMDPIDCPFRTFDSIYQSISGEVSIIIVDFHAEATSEKRAFGWYADGRASAVIGSHTHVQTADEEILPGGTAYITDMGMTGSFDSVIGMNKEFAIQRFLTFTRKKFEVSSKNAKINGVIIDFLKNGRSELIKRVLV
jgi:metallophosphoesterase (TIGR00282 family)